MSILITGASSARAYQVKNRVAHDEVLLGDYLELPATMINSGKMIRLPDPAGPAYAHEILSLCLDRGIEKIIVLNKAEMEALLPAKQLYNEYGILIETADDQL